MPVGLGLGILSILPAKALQVSAVVVLVALPVQSPQVVIPTVYKQLRGYFASNLWVQYSFLWLEYSAFARYIQMPCKGSLEV